MKTAVWMAVCGIAAASAQLNAQDALGNGRGLDNNLQVGGGKSNPANQQFNFNAGNNIITGNVGGVSRFHGRVGYGSPGEFRGKLPSNSLFRFQARSIQTTGGYSLAPNAVYRSGGGVTASDIANAAGNQLIIPRTVNTINPYKTFMPSTTINNRQPAIGTTRQPNGSKLQISAVDSHAGARPAGDLRPRTLDIGPAIGGKASTARDDMTIIGLSDTQLSKDRLSLNDPLVSAANIDMDNRANLQQPVDANAGQTLRELQSTKDQIDQQQTPTESTTIQNVYGKVHDLTQQNQQHSGSDAMVRPLTPSTNNQTTDASKMSPFTSLLPSEPDPNLATSAMDVQRALQIQRQRLQDLNTIDPLKVKAPQNTPQTTATKVQPQAPSAPVAPTDIWFLPEQLKPVVPKVPANNQSRQPDQPQIAPEYKVPAAAAIASAKDIQANRLLQEAQVQLAHQRYYDAIDTYLTVLRLRPDDAKAKIGQIHAQIGAGMMRTASFKLRRVLLKHPELINVKHDKKLLPTAKRLRWFQEELKEMIKLSGSVDAAILLAYLGFQLDNHTQIKSSLDLATERKPNDPVVILLRRVWLKDRSATQ